jgi:microcystin-dependent protein
MTVDALWLQNLDYPARLDRALFDNLWSYGVIGAGALAVSASAPAAMSVQVAAGVAVVEGTDQAFQGKYLTRMETTLAGLTITAAPGTGQRNDLVVVQVRDPNAGGAAGDDARIYVVVGTASLTPVDPTPPASCLVLARVRVPAGTGAITATNIDDLRTAAVVTQAQPSGSIMAFAGAAIPSGWLLCNGQAVSTTTYAGLYNAIGTAYNLSGGQSAPAAGTFRVPLLTGRVPVGIDATQAAFDTLGETGGSVSTTADHTHAMPHTHGINHDHASFDTATAGTHNHNASFSLSADVNGDHDHGVSQSNLENHTHGMPAKQTSSSSHTHTGTSTVAAGISGGTDQTPQTSPPAFVYIGVDVLNNGTHSHPVSGTVNVTTNEGSHLHAIDVPAFTGTSGTVSTPDTANSSTGLATGNLQPFITLNYIIKI